MSLAAAPALAQSRAESMVEQQRRNRRMQYQMQEGNVQTMPRLDVKRLEDVFQLRIEDGKTLTCTTPGLDVDKLNSRQYRLELENLKGPTYFSIGQTIMRQPMAQRGKLGPAKLIKIISLTNMEMGENDSISTITLQAREGLFHLSHSVSFDNGQSTVRLMQQSAEYGGGGDATVQLWVSKSAPDEGPININLSERDIPTLIQNHPKEAEQYLRPLLRKVAQEQILAPDWHVAWQVLADHWPVEEAASKRVSEILPGLSDPDFRKREQALKQLMELDRGGVTVLRKLERGKLSPEQNRLVDLAMAPYTQLPPKEADRLKTDYNFLLDCLYSDDANIRTAAIDQLKKVSERSDLKYDPAGSAPDRFAAVRVLRQSLMHQNG